LRKLVLYLQELRSPFFTATVVPVTLGGSIAWVHAGEFHWGLFLLALLGGLFLHAGTNVMNDYFDHRSGTDEMNVQYVRPFTGGSRMIQKGLLTPREVLWESILAYIGAVLVGVILTIHRGHPILILGAIGLFCGYFYTGTPLVLAARGLGELVIGVNFGLLMVVGSYYVQTGRFSAEPLLAAIPVALLIILVVFINEFQDMESDGKAGRRTLVVRLGKKRSSRVYLGLLSLCYLIVLTLVALRLISPFCLIVLLTAPIAARSAAVALTGYSSRERLVPANAGTIVLHLSFGLLLSVAYLLEQLLS
jgi:1,4-dihydroxy-2-naphthoate octaprenyltransferase